MATDEMERNILFYGPDTWREELLPVIGNGYPPSEARFNFRAGLSWPSTLQDAQLLTRDPEYVTKVYMIVVHADAEHGVEFATAMLQHLTTAGYKLASVVLYCHEKTVAGLPGRLGIGGPPGRLEIAADPIDLRGLLHRVLRNALDNEQPYRSNH